MKETYFIYDTKVIGSVAIAAIGDSITHLHFVRGDFASDLDIEETPTIKEAHKQLMLYLGGKLRSFELKLLPEGTPFQLQVWQALTKIPFGKTATYKDIAAMVKNPNAYRAIGNANHQNPIAIFIPCHRVIGSDGKLAGYGGGVDIKEKLLKLEGVRL